MGGEAQPEGDGRAYSSVTGLGLGAYGPGLIWSSALDEEFRDVVVRWGARELVINCSPGRPIDDLDVLADLPPLVGLRILPGRALGDRDWRAIEKLVQLRYLSVGHDKVGGVLKCAELPLLEWAALPWWRGVDSLNSIALKGLSLRGVKDGMELRALRPDRLEALQVLRSSRSTPNR